MSPTISDLHSDSPSLYSERSDWADVVPISQYEGVNPIAPIFYTPECECFESFLRCVYSDVWCLLRGSWGDMGKVRMVVRTSASHRCEREKNLRFLAHSSIVAIRRN